MAIGPGAYNPAVTLARFVKRGDFSVWMDPVLDIAAQSVGGALGAIVASWAMGAGAAGVADLGTASIIDALATAALALTYFVSSHVAHACAPGLALTSPSPCLTSASPDHHPSPPLACPALRPAPPPSTRA